MARDASMIAESQYVELDLWRVSRAAIRIAPVTSWTGKRRKDSMSRTACWCVMGSGRLVRVAGRRTPAGPGRTVRGRARSGCRWRVWLRPAPRGHVRSRRAGCWRQRTCTVVDLVATESVACSELADLVLHLVLQRLQPGELLHPPGQPLKVRDDQCAHRRITPRGGDPSIAVHLIGHRDRQILHSFTVTLFLRRS